MKKIHNDNTVEKIIQTAVRLIERDGYERLSLRTIADEMGTSIEVI
jgi:AcrR family transcriptional regulator